MAVLLLRFASSQQSWGEDSKFNTRRTNREPTKSGVVGMLAAALGIKRDEPEKLTELNQLKMGVRIDREGVFLTDFQMSSNPERGFKVVTHRHYLQDAMFLVGLEGDREILARLEGALRRPVFGLYFGRKGCMPSLPLIIGTSNDDLLTALRNEPSLCKKSLNGENEDHTFRIVIEVEPGAPGSSVHKDVPISFDSIHRQYAYRSVKELYYKKPSVKIAKTAHDPFAEF